MNECLTVKEKLVIKTRYCTKSKTLDINNNQITAGKLFYNLYLLVAKVNFTIKSREIKARIYVIADAFPLVVRLYFN